MDSTFFNDYIKKNLSNKKKSNDKSHHKSNNKSDKICHITFEPLEKNYIIFDCSHTFNYDAIFKEVCIQKTIINNKETQKLKKYCIKCPYCRFIQNGILPYREPYNLIPLVNTPKSKAFTMKNSNVNTHSLLVKRKENVAINIPNLNTVRNIIKL